MARINLVLFLGRSVEGIFKDVRPYLEGWEPRVTLVAREGDELETPIVLAGARRVTPEELDIPPSEGVVLVANGGTTSQLLPVLDKVREEERLRFAILDVQRDGVSEYHGGKFRPLPTSRPECGECYGRGWTGTMGIPGPGEHGPEACERCRGSGKLRFIEFNANRR